MAKFYKRGEPTTDELRLMAATIREQEALPVNRVPLQNEFGSYKLHDLENGEVELESERDGYLYRCYVIADEGGYRLIVDDYHPDEDASIKVDAGGQILEPFDDPDIE